MLKEKEEASFKEICSELGITDYDLDTNSPFVQVWNLDDFLKRLNLKSESDFYKFAEHAAAKKIMACAIFDHAITNKRTLIIKVNKEHPIGQVISAFSTMRCWLSDGRPMTTTGQHTAFWETYDRQQDNDVRQNGERQAPKGDATENEDIDEGDGEEE